MQMQKKKEKCPETVETIIASPPPFITKKTVTPDYVVELEDRLSNFSHKQIHEVSTPNEYPFLVPVEMEEEDNVGIVKIEDNNENNTRDLEAEAESEEDGEDEQLDGGLSVGPPKMVAQRTGLEDSKQSSSFNHETILPASSAPDEPKFNFMNNL